MLELIFQGFMEWAYGLALECWEYFSSSLLSIMSMDYNHVPVAFHTTPKEYEAITTSPTDLRRGRSEYGDE